MAIERYYSVCELGECFTNGTVTADTTAGHFDATFVREGIKCASSSDYWESYPFIDASAPTTIVTNDFIFATNASPPGINVVLKEWYNSVGVVVFRLRFSTNAWTAVQAEFWNGTAFVACGPTFSMGNNILVRINTALVCGATGSGAVYIDKTPVASGSITSASMNNVAKCRQYGAAVLPVTWSQGGGANFDLRDLNIASDAPNGAGADQNQTSGAYTDINGTGVNDTAFVSFASAALTMSNTHASRTPPGSLQIDSVWVNSRGRVNGGGPTDGKALIRSGGADYLSGALGFNGGFEPRGSYRSLDPNGGIKWSNSGYNSAQFGLDTV